jgi:hypothetical protein
LQSLNLSGSQVGDAGLKELKELKNLQVLLRMRLRRSDFTTNRRAAACCRIVAGPVN